MCLARLLKSWIESLIKLHPILVNFWDGNRQRSKDYRTFESPYTRLEQNDLWELEISIDDGNSVNKNCTFPFD